MLFPINIPYKITSGFGDRIHPVTGVKKFHNGIDIAVPEDTNVYNPENGTVDSWLTNDTGGKQMIVQHDNGMRTGYAHLNYRFYPVGSRVAKGSVIAKSGNTGASTGAHLHFTMKNKNGEFVNPQNFYFEQKKNNGSLAFLLTGLTIISLLYASTHSTPKTR